MNEPLRVAIALGKLGSHVHGRLDARRPFDDEGAFATGTVTGFWTIVKGLAEFGYDVHAYADVKEEVTEAEELAGADAYHIDTWDVGINALHYDALVSILESDLLDGEPKEESARICVQWLNDFSYARANPLDVVDLFISPSQTHANHLARKVLIPSDKISVVPLASNSELFAVDVGARRPLSIAYASSPDRGLHHLLGMFPEIRKRVPGAELRVYYRIFPWLKDTLDEKAHVGSKHWKRAVEIQKAFDTLGTEGQNGLYVIGQLTATKMASELKKTEILAYPLDPVKFTEGFSMTVLDACAAGCIPIVAGLDAFPELWSNATRMIPGRPDAPGARDEWIRTIVDMLLAPDSVKEKHMKRALARAEELSRTSVAKTWDVVIRKEIKKKGAVA